MPRRKLHDEEDDEVTTVGANDDLGPLDDFSDEDDEMFDTYARSRLFDDPDDEDEELFDDEDEEFYDEEE